MQLRKKNAKKTYWKSFSLLVSFSPKHLPFSLSFLGIKYCDICE